jgi:hypothetical protein
VLTARLEALPDAAGEPYKDWMRMLMICCFLYRPAAHCFTGLKIW